MHGFRRIVLGSLAVLSVCAVGCGKDIYPVKGRVTVDGKPVVKAMVRFLPDENSSPRLAYGETNENGEFTMATFKTNDGVLPGVYRVTITNPDNTMPPLGPPSGDAEDNAKAMLNYRRQWEEMKKRPQVRGQLPVLYAELETTPLRWTVPADGRVADFNIKTETGQSGK